MGDLIYAQNYRLGPIWEHECVTEILGPRRCRVRLLNEDQLWHRHQNQLCYCHIEVDNTQRAKITGATGTSPITGDSYPVFQHHEESAEDAETTASVSILATSESLRGTGRYPLWDRRPLIKYS